ncbi:MAG: cell wall hydrolase [Chelatococcus sp.]|nr:cell wall hydrolase [Chelatococcus sp. HY11]MBX3543855.1 cell wall hydrolase [Chelatococcus sp.]CAH1648698.1 Spore germination cell wall hydrolase CwlJ-like protein [Hyphomicrobiales bacterium]CAH1668198.1 Spore germination cell wall hydrolase CwlJ-like protein [Hyphomicrobiales bacterium]
MRLRRRSSLTIGAAWALGTVAPWALACGMLVSFTASAGQNLTAEVAFSPVRSALINDGAVLIQAVQSRQVAPMIALPGLGPEGLQTASLSFEMPLDIRPVRPEIPPKDELKASHEGYPQLDRSAKGDPIVRLRPGLSRTQPVLPARPQTPFDVVFSQNERVLPQTIFMPGSTEIPAHEDMLAFEPLSPEDLTLTEQATAPRSPSVTGAGGTRTVVGENGATPAAPRAAVLASTTPAPADATPMEIAAAPVSLPPFGVDGGQNMSTIAKSDGTRPNYASLVDSARGVAEEQCLAEAVYFEARGETDQGQAAVAQVVLNRAKSGLYPSTICGVVYQNRHRYKACQFSFACEGRSLRITEQGPWQRARRVASEVLRGKVYLSEVGGSTHYHADYVRPYWAKRLKKMDVIGRHIFYKLRPGQT